MLDYAAISEIGNRKLNEDYLRLAEKDGKYCFVVCDGLGGHGMGDIASQFVSNIFIEQFNTCEIHMKAFSNSIIQNTQRRYYSNAVIIYVNDT